MPLPRVTGQMALPPELASAEDCRSQARAALGRLGEVHYACALAFGMFQAFMEDPPTPRTGLTAPGKLRRGWHLSGTACLQPHPGRARQEPGQRENHGKLPREGPPMTRLLFQVARPRSG